MTIAFCLIGVVGNVIRMLPNGNDKSRFPAPLALTGIAFFGCLLVSTLLREKPPWGGLSDALSIVAAVPGISYAIVMMRRGRRKSVVALRITFAPSDKTWPPPPTSHP